MARQPKVDEERAVVFGDEYVPCLQVSVDDADAVESDEGAGDAGEDDHGVCRPSHAVRAQALPSVLEDEVESATLDESAVWLYNVWVGPSEADVADLAEEGLAGGLLP
jgi:hypothetical protein|tara:strand:- start:1049 stop:1372 length:324 start_codon:yes stop_codon:yes gene_type:complete